MTMTQHKDYQRWYNAILNRICSLPGIDGTSLGKKSQGIPYHIRQAILADLERSDRIRIERSEQISRFPRCRYWPISSETQQDCVGSTQAAFSPNGHARQLPSESERLALLERLRDADPKLIDWARVLRVAEACAAD